MNCYTSYRNNISEPLKIAVSELSGFYHQAENDIHNHNDSRHREGFKHHKYFPCLHALLSELISIVNKIALKSKSEDDDHSHDDKTHD